MSRLFIMCGIPFSGKSTLSKKIAEKLGFVRIDLDEVKIELLGQIMDEDVSQDQWNTVYQEMYNRIENNLKSGKTVIQDAGNFTKYERGLVREIADKLNIQSCVIYVDVPVSIARERWLKNKQTKSRIDVSEQAFVDAIKEMEPPIADENPTRYSLNTNFDEFIQSLKKKNI